MDFRRSVHFFLLLGFPLIHPLVASASSHGLIPVRPVISLAAGGLTVEWSARDLRVETDWQGRTILSIPGFDQSTQPGAPRLPFQAILVALPPGSEPSLSIESTQESTLELPAPLAITGLPGGVVVNADGLASGGLLMPTSQNQVPGDQPVQLEMLGVLRGVRLARLVFYPALPAGNVLQITTEVRVSLRYNAPILPSPSEALTRDPLLSQLREEVANPEHLQVDPETSAAVPPVRSTLVEEAPTVAIEVSKTGVTRITRADLAGAGFPVSNINPTFLTLTYVGEEVAYRWEGDSDAAFEPGEAMLFYADPRFSRWANYDTYFLSIGSDPGLHMASRPANPGSLPDGTASVEIDFESNTIYTPDCFCAPIPAGRDGDRWIWDKLQLPTPSSASYPFDLAAVDLLQPAGLTLWMIGFTDPPPTLDHRVAVSINDVALGNLEWSGKNAIQGAFEIPPGTLVEGGNTLNLSLPGIPGLGVDGVWLDAFSIRFSRSTEQASGHSLLFTGESSPKEYAVRLASSVGLKAFDVTNPEQPVLLTGIGTGTPGEVKIGDPTGTSSRRYWVTTSAGILTPENLRPVAPSLIAPDFTGAEYVIIAPRAFVSSLGPLLQLREQEGLTTAVEDIQAIYDRYGEGLPQPAAIAAFLADAYAHWSPRPAYVLLVGDGTSDPKRYLSSSSATLIPPFLADVDPWAGETATDNRYAAVDGLDNLPDLLVGRLPVNDSAELEVVVDKIVQYETGTPKGVWQRQAAFVADNPDAGGDFHFLTNLILKQFATPPFWPQRLFFSPLETPLAQFHEDVLYAWNEGAGLIMYTGHASIHQWAVENFLHLEDVEDLVNGGRLPVLLEMTCFTGSFQVPGFPTLDEALVRHPEGGAIAVWGSTGLGIATGHHWLAEGFMDSIYRQGVVELGTAVLAGKIHLATTNANLDLIDTFTLLGDPALDVIRSYFLFMPFTRN